MEFKNGGTVDFVCGPVWGRRGGSFYLVDQVHGRFDFPKTIATVKILCERWPLATRKLVEDKANGPAVVSQLKTQLPGFVPVEPRGSKQARVAAISPFLESGAVFLPRLAAAPWVEDLIAEAEAFPNGAHDDRVDALTQALDGLGIKRGGAFDFLRYCDLWDEEFAARRAGKLPETFATPPTSDPNWAVAEQRGSMLVAPIPKSPSHLPDTLEELIARTSR